MALRQQPTSSDLGTGHVPKARWQDSSGERNSVAPFPKAKSWQCSVYYYWWCFLKEHEGYRYCCENDGQGPHSNVYRDFGDVRGNDFRRWWKSIGRHLFSEHGASSNAASGVQGSQRYSVVGKPSLTLLHKRHRLLLLVRKFPETPLWKLFDISEDLSRGRTVSSIERNQKSLIARRYYAEAQSIVAYAARGLFPVRSACQLRGIVGDLSSTTPHSCRISASLTVKQSDE